MQIKLRHKQAIGGRRKKKHRSSKKPPSSPIAICVLQLLRLIHRGWHPCTAKPLCKCSVFWPDLRCEDGNCSLPRLARCPSLWHGVDLQWLRAFWLVKLCEKRLYSTFVKLVRVCVCVSALGGACKVKVKNSAVELCVKVVSLINFATLVIPVNIFELLDFIFQLLLHSVLRGK